MPKVNVSVCTLPTDNDNVKRRVVVTFSVRENELCNWRGRTLNYWLSSVCVCVS